MYIVALNGPSPVVMPIREAQNEDEAAARALQELSRFGYDPEQFKVAKVYGPRDLPRLQD